MRHYVLQLPDVRALLVISAPLIVALAMLRGVLCYMLIPHPFVVRAPAARTMCYSDTADQCVCDPQLFCRWALKDLCSSCAAPSSRDAGRSSHYASKKLC